MEKKKSIEIQTESPKMQGNAKVEGIASRYSVALASIAYFFSINLTHDIYKEWGAIIVVVVCIFFSYKPLTSHSNGAVRLMGKSYMVLVAAYLMMGIILSLFFFWKRLYVAQLVAAVPILLATYFFARNCETIEKSVKVFGLFKSQFLAVMIPAVWVFIDIWSFSADVHRFSFFPFALFSAVSMGIGFGNTKKYILELTDEDYELPVTQEEPHPIPMTRSLMAAVALAVCARVFMMVFGSYIVNEINSINLGHIMNYEMQKLFFPLILCVVYILVYPFISKRVIKGRNDDAMLHRRPLKTFLIAIVGGVVAFLSLAHSTGAGFLVILYLLIISTVYTYYITIDPALRKKSVWMTALTTVVGIYGGLAIIPVLIILFIIYFVFTWFFHYALHDMLSFGHSINFWDNAGDFHILNTVTMMDESGNHWRWI